MRVPARAGFRNGRLAWLLLLILFAGSVAADSGNILSMFQKVSIDRFYLAHFLAVDLLLYVVLFVCICQVTLGKIFKSRALVIVTGTAMAVSLALFEQSMGFNLRSAGPIVAGFLCVLTGALVLRLLRNVLGMIQSGAAAYIVTYVLLSSLAPDVMRALRNWVPVLDVVLVAAVILIVWKVFTLLRAKDQPVMVQLRPIR